MAGKLLLDTSFIVDFFGGNLAARRVLALAERVFIPVPVMGELFFGAEKSNRSEAKMAETLAFASKAEVLPCDMDTALHYGGIKNRLRAKGRPIPENDLWIAALAQQHALTLATRDSHFDEIATLPVLSW